MGMLASRVFRGPEKRLKMFCFQENWPTAFSGALKKLGLVKFTSFARTDCLRLQKYLDWLHSQNLLKLFAR